MLAAGVRFAWSRPWSPRRPIACVSIDTMRGARSRIWAATCYFVPDGLTQRLLREAAMRGVKVSLPVPGKSDVPLVQWAGS